MKGKTMPPFVAIVGALGGVAAIGWAVKKVRAVRAELVRIRDNQAEWANRARYGEPQSIPVKTLRRDPVTGAYRPG